MNRLFDLIVNKEDFNHPRPITHKPDNSYEFKFLTETEINQLSNEEYRKYKEDFQEHHLLQPNQWEIYNDDLSYKGSFASFGYQHIWNAFISSEFSWNHSTIYRNYTKDAVDTLNYEGGFNNYELSNVLSFTDDYTMVIGIDIEHEYGEYTYALKSKREKLGGYSQLIWNNPVLSFQLGGRVERNHHVNNNGDAPTNTIVKNNQNYALKFS